MLHTTGQYWTTAVQRLMLKASQLFLSDKSIILSHSHWFPSAISSSFNSLCYHFSICPTKGCATIYHMAIYLDFSEECCSYTHAFLSFVALQPLAVPTPTQTTSQTGSHNSHFPSLLSSISAIPSLHILHPLRLYFNLLIL